MSRGRVWLMLIPLFNVVWQFVIAVRVPTSIRNEYRDRGLEPRGDFGKGVGLSTCTCSLLIWVPYLGAVMAAVCLISGIVFWVKIAVYSEELARNDAEYDEGLPPTLR